MVSTGKMLAFINALGGGVAASSEVVILPETEAAETDDGFMIMTPLSATPTVGATAEINYNGAKYTSPIIYDEQNAMFAMGNTETMGIQGGNTDAPFFAALIPEGLEGAYGMVMPLDDATSVTLSIVQVGAASGGGSGSGSAASLIVNISMTDMAIDKPYSTVLDALNAGKAVQFRAMSGNLTGVFTLVLFGAEKIALAMCNFDTAMAFTGYVITPDGKVGIA